MKYYVYISDTKVNMLYDQIGLQEPTSASNLRVRLTKLFSESELRNLCFDLNVDYENLSGTSKQDKARELIIYLSNRNRLNKLLKECRLLRPGVDWLSDDSGTTTTKANTKSLRYARLDSVVDYIERNEEVGTVDFPRSYFRSEMLLNWGIPRTMSSNTSSGVMFVGIMNETALILGGSANHLIGARQHDTNLRSFYYLPSNLHGILASLESFEFSLSDDPSRFFSSNYLANLRLLAFLHRSEIGPEQRLEFLAKRLHYEGMQNGRLEEGYSRDEGSGWAAHWPTCLLVGSPIYVALVK